MTRVVAIVAISVLTAPLLVGAQAFLAPSRVNAAPPEFRLVADTTYEVRPGERLVRVTVDGRATSYKADTPTHRYYYTSVVVVVLGGATNFRALAAGRSAAVTVIESGENQVVVEVSLNRSVFYQQTGTFRLEFDLPTGAASGDVRVGAHVAAFPVWATGSSETEGSTVTLSLPPGFAVDISGEALPPRTERADGGSLYRWGPFADPIDFFPFVTADLAFVTEDAFTEVVTTASLGNQEVRITVMAWADDPDWGARVSERMTSGLPVLETLIGIDYFAPIDLYVKEAVPRTIGGYAGIYDEGVTRDTIEIAYSAGEGVTLHEAAHAWFNGSLNSERWVSEGFASYYAELAAAELGVSASEIQLTGDLRAASFPLNSWGHPGVADRTSELYAYAASLELAQAIGERAGLDGLALVWGAMLDGEAAYQPVDADQPERWGGDADWRYLLDLLEERTDAEYQDIFVEWAVAAGGQALIDDRAAARESYAALLDAAGDWVPDRDVRRAMALWEFDDATAEIEDADEVLARRVELQSAAAPLGLDLPPSLEADFEAGRYGRALEEADAQDTSLEAIAAATAADDGEDPFERIGLIAAGPDEALADARASFSAGDLAEATNRARAAEKWWREAAANGRLRLAVAGGVAGVLVIAAVAWRIRSSRRGPRSGERREPSEA